VTFGKEASATAGGRRDNKGSPIEVSSFGGGIGLPHKDEIGYITTFALHISNSARIMWSMRENEFVADTGL
jgi:hypothetical protein